ncbi:hypothetical protein [Vibrio cholerae]|uniref:hypothetical protein n=1 Tax=Vibrio cholerae TaxID=666 RepID=UPI0015609001|nr:hypothetical protein [Vibrio cholerae]NOF86795.1 hypothetical protein [Vibrio cholerae]NOF95568.1 hypothetical protein [Vibrio cholerae]
MKIITQKMKDNWLETTQCIINSPSVYRFNVGITIDSDRRASTYKNFSPSWPHFIILKTGMSRKIALQAERYLFEQLTSNKSSISYKKYRHDTRDNSYVASTGGLITDREYCLYIAWGTEKSYTESNN